MCTLAHTDMESGTTQQLLAAARDTMRSFQWRFPCDPLSAKLDIATECFRKYYTGVNHLLPSLGGTSSQPGKSNFDLTNNNFFGTKPSEAVPGILNFLASMYASGVRNSYRARIRYVVLMLEEHTAFFAGAVATATLQSTALPWQECLHCNNAVSALCTASPHTDLETQANESEQESIEVVSSSNGSDQQESSGFDNFCRFVDREASCDAMELAPIEWVAKSGQCSDNCPSATMESVGSFGQIAVHNSLKQEIRLQVEQTKTDQRLLPGKTVMLQAGLEALDVRIYSVGLLRLTGGTMISQVRLRYMQCYNIVRTTDKKVTCILV